MVRSFDAGGVWAIGSHAVRFLGAPSACGWARPTSQRRRPRPPLP